MRPATKHYAAAYVVLWTWIVLAIPALARVPRTWSALLERIRRRFSFGLVLAAYFGIRHLQKNKVEVGESRLLRQILTLLASAFDPLQTLGLHACRQCSNCQQCSDWKHWQAVIAYSEAHDRGNYERAIAQFERAIRINGLRTSEHMAFYAFLVVFN